MPVKTSTPTPLAATLTSSWGLRPQQQSLWAGTSDLERSETCYSGHQRPGEIWESISQALSVSLSLSLSASALSEQK